MKLTMIAAAMTVLLAGPSVAGPVVPGHLPSDAKWFGHVDVEAMRSVPQVAERMAGHREGKHRREAAADRWGFDPMADLLGVTLYSDRYEGDAGVMLLYLGALDQGRLVAALKKRHPDHRVEMVGQRVLYHWQGAHRHRKMNLTGVIAGDGLVIVGSDGDLVRRALAAVDGRGDVMKADDPLVVGVSEHAVLVSRAMQVPAAYQADTRCPVLRSCVEAFAQWTEDQGAVTAGYRLTANDAETAGSFKAIVEGMVALVHLKGRNDPAAGAVLDGLDVKVQEARFSLDLQTTTDELQAVMQRMGREGWGRHHGHHHGGPGEGGPEPGGDPEAGDPRPEQREQTEQAEQAE